MVTNMFSNYLIKVNDSEILNNIKYLFEDIRFYMGKSVLDGLMGSAYVDNINHPVFAILIVRSYCFISGKIDKNVLKEILLEAKDYQWIPDDANKLIIEDLFHTNINKHNRYSFYKEMNFDINKLERYSNSLPNTYRILDIDEEISNKIKNSRFMKITDNYKENGIGCYCTVNGALIGVCSSNIIYNDGIEINIKVNEKFRREGIATALASTLILKCLNKGLKVSWDAANLNSANLAKKLGFKYYGPYTVFKINE